MVHQAERFARFALGTGFEDLPAGCRTDSKHRLLDIAGVCLAAWDAPEIKQTMTALTEGVEPGPATVLGCPNGSRTSTAALVNGILAHAEDYDDTHTEAVVHPSAAVIPAALAAAEDVRASGAELLRAIALGMECSVRVGLAARGGFHAKGFHTTAIAAPFGSCIAAGVLLDLTENQLVNALGLAGSMAAGLFEFIAEGSNVKLMHTGWGAQSGIQAARLAQAGMTGPASVFEGRYGLFRAHLDGGFDAEVISADLGTRWHQLDTSFKPYPCCHFLHAVIDAFEALRRKHAFAPQDIETCTCLIPPGALPVVSEPANSKLNPPTGYAAKFSLAYTVAALIADGHVGLGTYRAVRTDERMRGLMNRIRAERDPESEQYPKSFGAAVRVRLRDGREVFHREVHHRGGTDRPMVESEIVAKFHHNAALGDWHFMADEMVDGVLGLEALDDIRQLFARLRGSAEPRARLGIADQAPAERRS